MTTTITTKSWRDVVEIHPAAELFPLMSPAEIKALGNDIRRNGLRIPTIWWRDRTTDKLYLLDGRNRLDALEAIGRNLVNDFAAPCDRWPLNLNSNHLYELPLPGRSEIYPDPYEYVLSANIHRRHLTAEQKRDLIAKLLKANPEKSDRQIGKMAQVSKNTAKSVRDEMEARGQIDHVEARTDTKGRQQPAKKSRKRGRTVKKVVEPEPVEQPENNDLAILSNPIARAWGKATNAQRKEFALEYQILIRGFVDEEQRRHPHGERRRFHHPANDLDTKIETKIETEENATNGAAAGDGDGFDIPEWLQRTAP
jgi:hypothetical protein